MGAATGVLADALRMELLHNVILFVGYYTFRSPTGQQVVHMGRSPTILQRLADLPIRYFAHPGFREVLFPTLIAACVESPRNFAVLTEELSPLYLADYLEHAIENSAGNDGGGQTDMAAYLARSPRGVHFSLRMRFPPED